MKNLFPSPRRALVCASIAVAASLSLVGCANPVESLMSSAAESALSEATGTEIDGIGSDAKIPDDFPASIPLPEAKPAVAMSQTQDGARSWILHFEEGMDDQVFDELKTALASSGFAEDSSSDMSGAMRIAVYSSSDYTVNLSLLGSSDETQILQMMVFEAANN